MPDLTYSKAMVPAPRAPSTQNEVRRFVVHITGTSTYINAFKNKIPPLQQLWNLFKNPKNNFSHYGIDPWGNVWQFALENIRPWSQGWGDYRRKGGLKYLLESGTLKIPLWWQEEWKPVLSSYRLPSIGASPLDLLFSDEDSPNANSISIELIQWQPDAALKGARTRNYLLTEVQYEALATLLWERATAHNVNLYRGTLLGHEDVDPWGRGTKDGGWDPGALREQPRFCWDCVFGALEDRPEFCATKLPTPPMPKWADPSRGPK